MFWSFHTLNNKYLSVSVIMKYKRERKLTRTEKKTILFSHFHLTSPYKSRKSSAILFCLSAYSELFLARPIPWRVPSSVCHTRPYELSMKHRHRWMATPNILIFSVSHGSVDACQEKSNWMWNTRNSTKVESSWRAVNGFWVCSKWHLSRKFNRWSIIFPYK